MLSRSSRSNSARLPCAMTPRAYIAFVALAGVATGVATGVAASIHACSRRQGALLRACAYAANAHRDQRRKNPAAEPYINHPLRVAALLEGAGVVEEDVLIAAVLHDVVEDTEVTVAEIEEEFGEVVMGYVGECSDDKGLPKTERKRLQVVSASGKSRGAKLVKLADKLDNLSDMTKQIPVGWSAQRVHDYFTWAEQVVAGLRGTNAQLEHQLDAVFSQREQAVKLASAKATAA